MECYSAFKTKQKNKEILSYATSWVNLYDIMLSETDQLQSGNYCMVPLVLKGVRLRVERAHQVLGERGT